MLNGSGRSACFHPEFLALCGYFCLQPIACARRDPESKGVVEGGVRYVKHNALAGRADELKRFEDYLALAPSWRDQVANVRIHETTRERPIDRFEQERALLRPLPAIPFDTDEVVPAVVSPHARIAFDGNRYSVPPQFVRKTLTVRASRDELRLLHEGQVVAQHVRSYRAWPAAGVAGTSPGRALVSASARSSRRWRRNSTPGGPRPAPFTWS